MYTEKSAFWWLGVQLSKNIIFILTVYVILSILFEMYYIDISEIEIRVEFVFLAAHTY